MQVHTSPVIFERFPGMRVVVVVASDIDNTRDQPALTRRWRIAWSDAAKEAQGYGCAQAHPYIQPWRESFRAMGVSGKKFPSAIEALVRRALKGEEAFYINPLVDFYHAISLQYIIPVGGFDLDALSAPLELRLTREGDLFQALDDDFPQAVPPGEVAYASGQTVLTRHLMWRQARTGLLLPQTRSAVLVAEIPEIAGSHIAESVRVALCEGLQTYFSINALSFILDAAHITT